MKTKEQYLKEIRELRNKFYDFLKKWEVYNDFEKRRYLLRTNPKFKKLWGFHSIKIRKKEDEYREHSPLRYRKKYSVSELCRIFK